VRLDVRQRFVRSAADGKTVTEVTRPTVGVATLAGSGNLAPTSATTAVLTQTDTVTRVFSWRDRFLRMRRD
jgi:hypothetical protein